MEGLPDTRVTIQKGKKGREFPGKREMERGLMCQDAVPQQQWQGSDAESSAGLK